MRYQNTVGKSDLVIGQEYFGSYVRKVKQEVEEKDNIYRIKRFVYLTNRSVLVEGYTRTTCEGKVESKEYRTPPWQIRAAESKDESDLRDATKVLEEEHEDLHKIYDVPAKIYPFSKLPERGDPVAGAWKHIKETDDSDWLPMDVVITKDAPIFLDIGEPTGIVALRKAALPDEEGNVDPFDLKFFAPGVGGPSLGYEKIGHWTPAKLNQQWPPVKPQPKPKVVEPKLPNLDGKKAMVVPKPQLPTTQDADAPLTGVWEQANGTDDKDWEPMFVEVSTNFPLNLKDGEPHGIVGVEEGVILDKDGNADPSSLKFLTPGHETPHNFRKLGHWRPSKLNQVWPPIKSKPPKPEPKQDTPLELTLPDFDNVDATVLPLSKVPKGDNRPDNYTSSLTGVWKHKDDTDDAAWDPMAVVISEKPPLFLEPGEPHGLVAIPKGVKPNKVGRLDPADLNFFTPRVKLPKKYRKVGHWRPEKQNQEWPPGKPSLPNVDGPATVVPNAKAPHTIGKYDKNMGVWKHCDGTDDNDWEPMDVDISTDFPLDLKPEEPYGIVAVEEGIKSDMNGKLKPSDLKFFMPGERPPIAYNKLGYWRPGKINQMWPPVKRKMPNFEGAAIVVPKSKAPEKQIDDAPLTGVWKHYDGTNDNDWCPMDVIITKKAVAFLLLDEPHGFVAVEGSIEPNDNGTINPSDISFFKPGEEPPSTFNKVGHWRPGKLNQDWPPTKPISLDFEGPARIWPKSKAPYKQSKDLPLTGVWKHLDGEDDSHWDKLDVMITKEEPLSLLLPEEIYGIVAIDKHIKAHSTRTIDPSDICFFLPDESPPSAFTSVGYWRPGRVHQTFPPVGNATEPNEVVRDVGEPILPSFNGDYAKVYSKSKIHKSIKDYRLVGVWEHNDDTDDTDWETIGVIVTNEIPVDEDFHGIVAAEENAKFNKVGKLDPSFLKFFTPGEEPPENYSHLGYWKLATKLDWQIAEPSQNKSIRKIGKLNLPDFDVMPETGVIYPRSQAPESHDSKQIIAKGVWKWSKPENKPENAESWIPAKIEMYEDGEEPHNWDETQSNGVWGVNPGVDMNSGTKPTDLWFYPPNEKPDEGFEPIGKWRPKKAAWSYPPKSIGKVEDKRVFKEVTRSPVRNVGKLRVPSFFKGK